MLNFNNILFKTLNFFFDLPKKTLDYYLNIIKLPVFFQIHNIYTIVVVSLCAILSIFLNEKLYLLLLDYQFILTLILIISNYYVIFLQFNLISRFFFTT